jgi:hypothetical protein
MSPYEQPPPRPRAQRKADVLAMLAAETDIDLWVASADASGRAHLIPLSYGWDGATVSVATPTTSRTALNLIRAGWARLALGTTRDVVIIEGPVEAIPMGTDPELEDQHARSSDFDPREMAEEYIYLRVTPHNIQAWRESAEIEHRQLMRGGEWLV